MDEDDKKDIIKKVNTSGDDGEDNEDNDSDNQDDSNDDSGDFGDFGDDNGGDLGSDEDNAEEDLQELSVYESKMNNLFLDKPKKNNMFQEGSNDILDETKPCWKGYKQVGMKEKNGREVPNCVPIDENHELTGSNESSNNYMFWQNLKGIHDDATEILGMNQQEVDALIADGHQWAVEHVITSKDDVEEVYHFVEAAVEGTEIHEGEHESNNYMFWSSLKTIQHASGELLQMDYDTVDTLLSDGHGWALDHIATSADDMEEVYHFLANTLDAYDGDTEGGYEDEYGNVEDVNINEAEYHGKKVSLGKL